MSIYFLFKHETAAFLEVPIIIKVDYYRVMKFRCRFLLCVFFFLLPLAVFAGGRTVRTAIIPNNDPLSEAEKSDNASWSETAAESWGGDAGTEQASALSSLGAPMEGPGRQSRAEAVMRAIAKAYPDRAGEVEFIDGDWTIEVYGERFYFAEGRMLPLSLRNLASEYDPQPFYNYLEELPPWEAPSEEESARMKAQDAARRERPSKRSSSFFDTLWRTHDKDESWEHVKQIRLFGHTVMVHYSILEKLSLAEEQILRIAKTNAQVRQWISSLNSIEGWNWRDIASTQSRSFHAYGAAIDFMPKSLGGLETYWLWTSRSSPEWWAVPYSKRFHPPAEVIKAFESFGFIWGGKWRYYDTMHFEYRPEILELSEIPVMDLRNLR